MVEGKGRRHAALSTPWNIVGVCAVVEEEDTGRVLIGYPTGEEPAVHPCHEETEEIKAERESHLHCYKVAEGAAEPEPPGCINLTIVDPTAGIEIAYGGTLRPRWTNGAGNGLEASRWEWEGETSGELACQLKACAMPGTYTGKVKIVGYEAQELIQIE